MGGDTAVWNQPWWPGNSDGGGGGDGGDGGGGGGSLPPPVDYGAAVPADIQGMIQQLLRLSATGQINPFMQVGDSSDVSQINPYTNQTMQQLQGMSGQAQQQAFGGGAAGSPQAMVNQQLSAIMSGDRAGAPDAFNLADLVARDATRDVANMYSGSGALYSGPAAQVAGEAAHDARQKSLLSYTQQLGDLSQGYQQTGAGLLGQVAGMQTAMGSPQYYTPSYVTNPQYTSPLDYYALQQGIQSRNMATVTGGLGAGGNILGAILGAK